MFSFTSKFSRNRTHIMDYEHTDILHNGGLEGLEDYKVFRRRYPSRTSLPVRYITDWHIQEIPMVGRKSSRWICLVGIYKDALIRTSPIVSSISPRKVSTCNCIYVLGPSTKVLENPLLGIERSFADGFPGGWEGIVEKAFADADCATVDTGNQDAVVELRDTDMLVKSTDADLEPVASFDDVNVSEALGLVVNVDGGRVSVRSEEGVSIRSEEKVSIRGEERVSVRNEDIPRASVRSEEKVSIRNEDVPRISVRSEDVSRASIRSEDMPRVSIRGEDVPRISIRNEDAPRISVRSEDGGRVSVRSEDMPRTSVKNEDVPRVSVRSEDMPRVSIRNEDVPRVSVRGEDIPRVSVRNEDVPRVSIRSEDGGRVSIRTEDMPRVSIRGEDVPRVSVRSEDVPRVSIRNEDMPRVSIRSEDAPRVSVRSEDIPRASVRNEERVPVRNEDMPRVSVRSEDMPRVSILAEEALLQHITDEESTVSLNEGLISTDIEAGKLPNPNISIELGDESHMRRNRVDLNIRSESVREVQQDLISDNASDDGRRADEQTIREINGILSSTASTLSPAVEDNFDNYDKSLFVEEALKQSIRGVGNTPSKDRYPTVEELVRRSSPFKLPLRIPARQSTGNASIVSNTSVVQGNNSGCFGEQPTDKRPSVSTDRNSLEVGSAKTQAEVGTTSMSKAEDLQVTVKHKDTADVTEACDDSFNTQDFESIDSAEVLEPATNIQAPEDKLEVRQDCDIKDKELEHSNTSKVEADDMAIKKPRLSQGLMSQEASSENFNDKYFERIKLAYSDQLMSSPMKPQAASPDSGMKSAELKAKSPDVSVQNVKRPSIKISIKPRSTSSSLSRQDIVAEKATFFQNEVDLDPAGFEIEDDLNIEDDLKTVSLIEDEIESGSGDTKEVNSTVKKPTVDTTIANDTVISESTMVRSEKSKIGKLPVKVVSTLESEPSVSELNCSKSFSKTKKKKTMLVMPKRLKSLSKTKRK